MGIEAIAGLLTNLGMTAQTAQTVATGVNVVTGTIGQGMEFLGLGGAMDASGQFLQGLTGGTPAVTNPTSILTGASPYSAASRAGELGFQGKELLGSGIDTAMEYKDLATLGLAAHTAFAKPPKIGKSRSGAAGREAQRQAELDAKRRGMSAQSRFAPAKKRAASTTGSSSQKPGGRSLGGMS